MLQINHVGSEARVASVPSVEMYFFHQLTDSSVTQYTWTMTRKSRKISVGKLVILST